MKHDAVHLLKFKKLHRRLGFAKRRETIGLLETLWHFCYINAPRGDIGQHDDETIAIEAEWDGEPGELISALIETGWLDECDVNRLIVHDWDDHIPKFVRGNAARKGGVIKEPVRSVLNDVSKPSNGHLEAFEPPVRSLLTSVSKPSNNITKHNITQEASNEASPPPSETANGEQYVEGLEFVTNKSKQVYRLPVAKLEEYRESFPAVDVMSQLRTAAQWLRDNPKNRKTKSGVPRFLTNWLARTQNSARPGSNGRAPPKPNKPDSITDRTNEVTKLVQAARKRGFDTDWIEKQVHELDRQGLPIDDMRRSLANAFKQEAR